MEISMINPLSGISLYGNFNFESKACLDLLAMSNEYIYHHDHHLLDAD